MSYKVHARYSETPCFATKSVIVSATMNGLRACGLEVTMPILFLVMLLIYCTPVLAGEIDRPTGQNCNLVAPPDTAGETSNHGVTLRIYPRAREIDTSYSGCQSLWVPDKDEWSLIFLVVIESGDPVRIWSPDDPDQELAGCVYQKGEVVKGDPETCPAPRSLIMKSLAPGCEEKIRSAIAKDGLGAPLPPDCDYE
jgi:hypothetical protein